MHGKRFTTPAGPPAMRHNGYTQLHASSSSTSPGRSVAAARRSSGTVAPATAAPERRFASQARPRPRPSPAHMPFLAPTPERRPQAHLGSSSQSSMPSASVHHMLSELVDLSHSIAALLDQGQVSPSAPAPGAPDRQQEVSLKAQEIERIVRRVEAHFVDHIRTLEAANASLAEESRQLRGTLAAQRAGGGGGGVWEESEALDARDPAVWSGRSGNGGGAALGESEQLRRVLVAEKRQRLRVEEQTQLLTEQHAKVVGTLERRLKKQEEQLYDLIAAIDRGYGGGASTASASPTRSTDRSSPHRLATPRRLLRQQLAQHQQTQRALQQYKENLLFDPPSPTESEEATGTPTTAATAAAGEGLGLDDVRRTLESIRASKPLTVSDQLHSRAAAQESTAARRPTQSARQEPAAPRSPLRTPRQPHPPPPESAAAARADEVDEITMFLENITKELESLDVQ
ncbi:hypothetical protein NESM_000007500 [Novymonas esmeraldas]|uniref:Uncharacterized protein n=1 Tax=Novymonas esmeraldas TaxID=1808958 RepID=A0AAW0F212_9TRYP